MIARQTDRQIDNRYFCVCLLASSSGSSSPGSTGAMYQCMYGTFQCLAKDMKTSSMHVTIYYEQILRFLQVPPIPDFIEEYLSTLIKWCWMTNPKVTHAG